MAITTAVPARGLSLYKGLEYHLDGMSTARECTVMKFFRLVAREAVLRAGNRGG